MKRETKILWIPLAAFIAIGVVLVPIAVRGLVSTKRYCREVSAWGALDCSIMLELNDYYEDHGKYPESLEGLNIVFEDGAVADMLNEIQYQADGTSCKYRYYRHAGNRDSDAKTLVVIEFSKGQFPSYTETTVLK